MGPLKYAARLGEEGVSGGGGVEGGSKKMNKMKHPECEHKALVAGQYMA